MHGTIIIPLSPFTPKNSLGWVTVGKKNAQKQCFRLMLSNLATASVHKSIERFWALEDNFIGHDLTPEEAECEDHFRSTFSRHASGRFIVKLPFKGDPVSLLGNSKEYAGRRFLSVEKKLKRQLSLKEQYCDFIAEHENNLAILRNVLPHLTYSTL